MGNKKFLFFDLFLLLAVSLMTTFLHAQWTQGNNQYMIDKGFVCADGTNGCISGATSTDLLIQGIGLTSDEASLVLNHAVTDGANGAINIKGINYLSIVNNSSITANFAGIFIDQQTPGTTEFHGYIANDVNASISSSGGGSGITFRGGFYANIMNWGTIGGASSTDGISNTGDDPDTVFYGNIVNASSGIISGTLSGIFVPQLRGYVQNAGTIQGGAYSIYSSSLLDYRGSGTLTGTLYVENGVIFSGMTRTAINDVAGSGGITYDGRTSANGGKGGEVQLNLAYTVADMNSAKIISTIGNLTLNTVTLNLTGTVNAGKYLIATSNTVVASDGNLNFMINGGATGANYTADVRYANSNTEMWMYYYLNYWTNGDNSHMTIGKDFTCSGANEFYCTSTVDTASIKIQTVGLQSDSATLTNNNTISGNGINIMAGTNYLNITNNSAGVINGNVSFESSSDGAPMYYGIYLATGSTLNGSIVNLGNINASVDSGYQYGIRLNGTFVGNILNQNTIQLTSGAGAGIYVQDMTGNITNNGTISANVTEQNTISGAISIVNMVGDIINSGTISAVRAASNPALSTIYISSSFTGNIINNAGASILSSSAIAGVPDTIRIAGTFDGYIQNEGTISGQRAIYSSVSGQRIDYRGSGTLDGLMISNGGFIFSGMNRTPINQTNIFSGSGGIIYDGRTAANGGKGGAVQLNLDYAVNNMHLAKIVSNIGDLTLNTVTLNLTYNGGSITSSGSYFLASSSTLVNYITGTLTLLNNGADFSTTHTYTLRYENNNKELWLDLVLLPHFWTQGDNLHMTSHGFVCVGTNDCTLSVSEDISAEDAINIVNVGLTSDYATMQINQGVNLVVRNINISGDQNYLNILNRGTINGGILFNNSNEYWNGSNSVWYGDITNAAGAVITGATSAIEISGASSFYGNIINSGTLGKSDASYGIYLFNGSSFNGNIINNIEGTVTGAQYGIYAQLVSFNGKIENYGTIEAIYFRGARGSVVVDNYGHINGANVGIGVANSWPNSAVPYIDFSINNYSVISAANGIILVNSIVNGNITNAYSSSLIQGGAFGIYMSSAELNGIIDNSGIIKTSEATGIAVSLSGSSANSIINQITGDINSSASALSISASQVGTIENYGSVSSDTGFSIDIANSVVNHIINGANGILYNGINVNNSSVAIIDNYGMIEDTISFSNSDVAKLAINNFVGGLIAASSTSTAISIGSSQYSELSILNAGAIESLYSGSRGIYLGNVTSSAFKLENQIGGVITADVGLRFLNSNLTGSIVNAGSINVKSQAIVVSGDNFNVDITNLQSGIIANSAATSQGLILFANSYNNTIYNSGKIINQFDTGYAIDFRGAFGVNGVIENDITGIINSTILFENLFAGSILNKGQINDIVMQGDIGTSVNSQGRINNSRNINDISPTGSSYVSFNMVNSGSVNSILFENSSIAVLQMENTITGDIKNLVFDTGRLRGLTLANDGIISTLSFNAYDFDGSNFINNSANGEIVNAAGNGISFENISVANAATFEINNYGLLQGSAGFNGISFVNSVVNSGVLSLIVNNYEDGDILGASSIYLEKMNVSLQVSNAGTMDSIRALETVFVNGSGITNESLGILNGIVFADNSSYVGNIVNHGKIDGEDYGILLADSKFGDTANGYGAIISNTGDILGSSSGIQFEGSSVLAAIYNYDEIAGNTGIVLSNLSNDSRVDIMNYENAIINGNNTGIDVNTPYFLGTIENEGMIYGLRQRAVSFVNTVLSGASIINSSTGVISALKEALYFEGDTEIDLALKNSGIISSTEEAAVSFNGSKITAGSEISNMEGGTITGDYVGMIFSGVEFAGNIINQGLIQGYNNGIIFNSGSIIAANAQLVNYGTIQGSNSALQISQSSNLNGTILNYGLIEGGAYGIIISSSTANAGSNSDIVNQQGGTVAGRYGIYITDSTFIGNIVNDGVIEGEIDAITVNGSIVTADKGLVGNGKLMGERSGLRISNSQWQGNLDLGGEIDAGQYGVWIGNNSSIIGVIDNFGLISSENTGIYIDNATLDLQAPFRNSGTVSGSDYGIWMDNTQLVNKLVINNDGGKITSSGIAVYLGSGLSNQEFDIHNENGTIMGGTYSVSFEESGAVSNSNQILNYYSSQSSVLRGKINMGGTSDHDVFNMSSGYATNLQVINVEEVNLSPTSASDRLVLDNRYGSFLDLTNMPNFVNENGPLVINVENNAQTDPNDEFWKRQVNIKFDTVNTNLKVGDKILVASSNSGLTINGEFGWDLGLNKLFGEYQQIGNDLYFVITKAYYEVRKANTNSFALIGQTRRLDDIIQKNQMVDLYMNKMRGDLTVDFAQNKNVMYDFYVNQLYKVRKSGLWVEYYQGNENYKKQGLVKKYDNDFKGVVVGYDRNIDKGIFGIALSYSKDNGDTFNEYSAVIDAYKGTLYGSYDFGPVFVIGNIGYSYADLDMDVVGTFDDYSEKGSVYFGSFVAGTMITKNTFAATLYSKLDVAYADTDYEEKTESQLGSLGIDLKYGYKFMSREKLIPSIYYEYGYEFSDSYLSFVNISHDNGYLQADYDYDLGKSVQKVGLRLNFMGRYGDSLAVTVEQNWREGMDAQEVRFNGTYKF